MAVRLSIALGSSPESWMGHQTAYDLWKVEQHKEELNVHPMWKINELADHPI
jgi:plasmid maintenance system antidote protein VapI